MNILSKLSSAPGAKHKAKRLGRGRACGCGGTSTKGHKGQKARSGHKPLRGFEGGQMPLVRRLPKFGFTNTRFKTQYNIFNLSDLNRFDKEVNVELLTAAGKKSLPVKILGRGVLKKALKVQAHRFSRSAVKAIEKAGGQVETILPG